MTWPATVFERTKPMFAVIITVFAVIVAIRIISSITVEITTHQYDVECECVKCQQTSKEIRNMSKLNVKSIEEYAAIYAQWVSIDTSVEEYSAAAVDVIITTTGTWKMTYVVNKSVKFTGRTSYTGKTSGWLFENVNTGASDMYLQISGKSSAWEARNWFGNGNFAVNTKVAVK
jgi:hypothetical protein